MPRILIAAIVGPLGFLAYVAGAVTLADHVANAHWAVQVIYFVIAGVLWTMPVRWLMLWSVGQR